VDAGELLAGGQNGVAALPVAGFQVVQMGAGNADGLLLATCTRMTSLLLADASVDGLASLQQVDVLSPTG
jgi:hypothetical protein